MQQNKYETILKAAAHLISKKGYDGTSFQEIADRVGIHKSTIFYYFKTKEELILRIMEKSLEGPILALQQIIANEELTPEEKLKRAIESHLSLLIAHAENVNIYLNEFRALARREQAKYLTKRKIYEKDFQAIVSQMQKAGYFSGLDPKIVTFGILGMVNWVIKWFKNDGRFTIKEVSNIFYGLITQKTPAGD
jgi:TetR/AcrR family transcriptional regulator, cholesterol catabolism regulator